MVDTLINRHKSDERNDFRHKSLNRQMEQNISSDFLKFIFIIILLISSMIMYSYEPSPARQSITNTNENLNHSLKNTKIDDNPYGFHPFYQVHKRIQYKNPTINTCHDINPSKTILFAILSRASNVHIREAIRQTWGAIRMYNDIEIRLTFIVGVDDGMLKQIEIEQRIHHGKYSSV